MPSLGLPPPRRFAVPANTLVIADTRGFHARGASVGPTCRVEVWVSGRNNPFVPWFGPDPWVIGNLGGVRVPIFWAWMDMLERAGIKNTQWEAVEDRALFED